MQLFFADNIESDICTLPPEESKHCVKVLRMGVGATLHLTDGQGSLCVARIVEPNDKGCVVAIEERQPHYGQRNHYLHLAVAPTKNTARLEWLVEKAVEIGIDEISPIICEHSERTLLKSDRLEKIVVSAMKQSLKTYKPQINAPVPITEFLNRDFDGCKMVAHCEGDARTKLQEVYNPGSPAVVLIGPEGDFSEHEINQALRCGYRPITLGPCRLRTETAALYAVVAINFLN